MRPRRTVSSNAVYRLTGGNEDNDLWAERRTIGGINVVCSTWDFTDEERQAIANGACIELAVFCDPTPPVSMIVVGPEGLKGQ